MSAGRLTVQSTWETTTTRCRSYMNNLPRESATNNTLQFVHVHTCCHPFTFTLVNHLLITAVPVLPYHTRLV